MDERRPSQHRESTRKEKRHGGTYVDEEARTREDDWVVSDKLSTGGTRVRRCVGESSVLAEGARASRETDHAEGKEEEVEAEV